MNDQAKKRMFEALWETQWTQRWAAENVICAHQDCLGESYEDQSHHQRSCSFVKLWADLKHERQSVGETREPLVGD